MSKKIIVFDLDGTLSIVGDRLKYLKDKDWDSFYEACDEDEPNDCMMKLLYVFKISNFFDIRFVTGRRESVREKTLNWLNKQGVVIESKKLYMRPNGDYRHDTELKPELVRDFIDDILMVFEDRTSMVKKWRELGITCLQVADGDF